MRAWVLSLLIVTSFVVVAPGASAQPCEVPFCNVTAAALCIVSHGRDTLENPKGAWDTTRDCLTQPA